MTDNHYPLRNTNQESQRQYLIAEFVNRYSQILHFQNQNPGDKQPVTQKMPSHFELEC